MFDILSIIPSKKRRTSSGWVSFNCPACIHKGHRPDKKYRGGLKYKSSDNWYVNCFNCGFTCSFTIGKSISKNCESLLYWCGVDKEQIQKWSFESLKHVDLLNRPKKEINKLIKFPEQPLPDGQLLDSSNPEHSVYIEYLNGRSIDFSSYPFMVTPHAAGRNRNRIIVPFTYDNVIVGHTSRYLDNNNPKFVNKMPTGYLFGTDLQKNNWEVCILVEGVFDALSIDGCALLHNDISKEQQLMLSKLNRKVICVPDRDKAGLKLCDKALELGYSVSIPDWDIGIKDTNDSCKVYGKLPTLLSILQSATTSKIKVDMSRRKILADIEKQEMKKISQ